MSTPNLLCTSKVVHTTSPSACKLSSGLDDLSIAKERIKEPSNSDLVEEEQSSSGWAKTLFGKRTGPPRDRDAIATRRSVFDDPHLAPFYWPRKDYENIHCFDPSARWTYREEKALLRKIDWKIMTMAAISFSTLGFDRVNINQANSTSFLTDMHMTTNDFNMGNTIFLLSLLCVELPSQMLSKRVGPDRWIPTQMCLWSIIPLSQFWLTGRTYFLASRALLGFLQGGFVPQLVLYMSYFYTKTEFPIRLVGLSMSMNFCGIIASFLAYGILHLDGVAGKAGWRWLFLIEGMVMFSIGVFSFFNMPPSLTQTKAWFRPKGWFIEREEIIMVNKILRDDPTKGDMHNREGLTLKRLWTAICDYDLWPVYILFNTFDTNLLAIPSQAMAIITMFLIVLVSESVNERTIVTMMQDLWVLPFLVALYALPPTPIPWLFFGLVTGLLSSPFTNAIRVGWCSRNSGAVASRTVNATLYNMFFVASGLISAQIYVASDAPKYERGNRILITICSVNLLLLYPGTKVYYMWRNYQRAKIWDAMTPEEKVHYLKTTKDVGNRRLDFRFAH